MKKLVLSALIVLVGFSCSAQSFILGYNSTAAGESINGIFAHRLGKNEFYVGLGVNLQNQNREVDNSVFYKQLHAAEPIHYLNFTAGYQRVIFKAFKHIDPYFYIDLQVKHAPVRPTFWRKDYLNNRATYVESVQSFGPFLWLEQQAGIGVTFEITKHLFMTQKVGLGVSHLFGQEDRLVNDYFAVYSPNFCIGLGWRLAPDNSAN